ncbi:MAG: ABC transporter ATP-binding protein [Phycicoccus sp.]
MAPRLGDTDHARRSLPIAGGRAVRRHVRVLLREHRRHLVPVLGLHALAALVGLTGPFVIGQIVGAVTTGENSTDGVDVLVGLLAGAVLAEAVVTWLARRSSFVLSERVFAQLREDFVSSAVRLPLSTVERAGTGDLLSRTTNDIEAISYVIRFGIPSMVVSAMTVAVILAATVAASPLAAIALLVTPLVLWRPTRRYLRLAGPGYLWEHATYARLNGVAAETVEGLGTVDALGLQEQRGERFAEALAESHDAERYTTRLRLRWFPWIEVGFFAPVGAALLWSGWLAWQGWVSVATATTVVLYVQRILDPIGELVDNLDEIQFAATSMSRILGVAEVPPDRVATGAVPTGDGIRVEHVRYAYREGRDVLHGVSLDLRPGERLAIVGPSGAGKSTLGRLMAGVDAPRSGRITVGGVPLTELGLDVLRGEVALVTQEHHVFVGTVAENLRLPRPDASDDELRGALEAVDALEWAEALPSGLATVVGSGGHGLSEAQAQQLALARLVLADPHTLVLDEATSLLDPRAARHLERSLAAVVTGRTVVAIAHRLHTAHDADRVAVVEDGRVSELGAHTELLAAGGSYAALWRSWRDQS